MIKFEKRTWLTKLAIILLLSSFYFFHKSGSETIFHFVISNFRFGNGDYIYLKKMRKKLSLKSLFIRGLKSMYSVLLTSQDICFYMYLCIYVFEELFEASTIFPGSSEKRLEHKKWKTIRDQYHHLFLAKLKLLKNMPLNFTKILPQTSQLWLRNMFAQIS